MKSKIIGFLTVLLFLTTAVSYAESTEIIDTSQLVKGIVNIGYDSGDSLKYKVLVTKDDQKIAYPFKADGNRENFPLQLGHGTYKVGLLKNVSGTKYVYVAQKTIDLKLEDPNVVFLNSTQNVKWDEDMEAIDFGKDLLAKLKTANKRTSALYGYLVKNMSYDYDKIPTLTSDYIPSIEDTFEQLKGICYDYSALFASIERNHGIPTKLVKGYSKYVEGYHAWNEVYIDGKWVIIDNTVDSTWKGSTTGLTMVKSTKYYTKVNEY